MILQLKTESDPLNLKELGGVVVVGTSVSV